MQLELKRWQAARHHHSSSPFFFVTHDQHEALTMSDRKSSP